MLLFYSLVYGVQVETNCPSTLMNDYLNLNIVDDYDFFYNNRYVVYICE